MRHAATSGPPPDTRTACTGTGHTALQSELRAQPSGCRFRAPGRDPGTRQDAGAAAASWPHHAVRRPPARAASSAFACGRLYPRDGCYESGATDATIPRGTFQAGGNRVTATRFVKPLSVGRNERTRATAKSNKTKPAVTRNASRRPNRRRAALFGYAHMPYPAVGRWDCISSCPNMPTSPHTPDRPQRQHTSVRAHEVTRLTCHVALQPRAHTQERRVNT